MSRSLPRQTAKASPQPQSRQQPVSKEQYIRETVESCRNGECCRNSAMLDAAYAEYVNDPKAPWNKSRKNR